MVDCVVVTLKMLVFDVAVLLLLLAVDVTEDIDAGVDIVTLLGRDVRVTLAIGLPAVVCVAAGHEVRICVADGWICRNPAC